MALKQILLIRHAEKPDDPEDPNLTSRGEKRAHKLAKMLRERYGAIDEIFAATASKHSNRPVLTVTPLAKAVGERIRDGIADQDYGVLAERLLSLQKHDGKRIVICWHHGHIPDLARALGATDVPKHWPHTVFDRVWNLEFAGDDVTLTDEAQKLLSRDSTK
jgi:phosphohistidine phosphatase SixA